jgi:hypothetical protein
MAILFSYFQWLFHQQKPPENKLYSWQQTAENKAILFSYFQRLFHQQKRLKINIPEISYIWQL